MFLSYYLLVSFIFVLPFHSFYYHPNGASLVAQTVKHLPTMQETRVQSLGGKIPWRRKWQPTPVFLPREFHGQTRLADYSPWDHKRVIHDLATKQQYNQLKSSKPATKMEDPVCLS